MEASRIEILNRFITIVVFFLIHFMSNFILSCSRCVYVLLFFDISILFAHFYCFIRLPKSSHLHMQSRE